MLQWDINYFNISLAQKVPLPSCHLSPSKNCFVSLQSPELCTAHVKHSSMFRSSLCVVPEHVGGLAVPGGLEVTRGITLADRHAQTLQQPQYHSMKRFEVPFFYCTLLQIVTRSMQEHIFSQNLTYHGWSAKSRQANHVTQGCRVWQPFSNKSLKPNEIH